MQVADVRPLLARHALAIVLAVALGALLVFPRWWMLTTDPPEGARVPVSVWGAWGMGSDEALQTVTLRDAYDGELPVRSPHLVNHRNDSLQAGAGWQQFIGMGGHVFGGPFESLAVVSTVMGIAAFMMLYVLAYNLTGSRLAAASALPLAALFGLVMYRLDEYTARNMWRYIEPFLTLQTDREFLPWTRFLSPIVTLATFFTLAWSLPRAAKTGELRWCVVAALALALLVYSYVFYWSAAALAIAFWLGLLLVRRDFDAARRVLLVGIAAVLIALPEFAIVANKSLTSTEDIQGRVGQGELGIIWVETSEILARLLAGLPFMFVLLRRRTVEGGFYVALFVAPLVLAMFDGVVPQSWHFRSQVWSAFAIPAFIAGGAEFYRMLGEGGQRFAMRGLAVAAVLASVYLAAFQVRVTTLVDDAYAVSDDEHAAFEWIEDNVSTRETVASPSVITTLMLANLTPASGYIIGGYNPVVSDDELIDRFLRIQTAYGYDEAVTFERLDPRYFGVENVPSIELQRQVEMRAAYYNFYWEVFTPDVYEERIPAWRERFRALAGEENVLAAYPVEYLYCGPRERFWPMPSPAPGTYVRPAFERDTVTVYAIVEADDPQAAPFAGC
ncbi:MAG: hypothetical protein WD359_00700 [Dehalococcoidia bacterium]